jgi:acetyltransferase-like isoleucine patch superfamily enzyme
VTPIEVDLSIEKGAKIGKFVRMWGRIDLSRPDLVTIGDYVIIGGETCLITHCPIKLYKDKPEIVIGNNVYIGMKCCVLPGVTIGDNVIIGAGSVVSKDIPSNSIAAGNPCRVIRAITEKELLRTKLLTEIDQVANGYEPIGGDL